MRPDGKLVAVDVCVVDFYTDEPAGLGVPPYLGTTVRYVYGAVLAAGSRCRYINVDDLRLLWGRGAQAINLTKSRSEVGRILERSDLIVTVGGMHTPGRYLRAMPGSPREIRRLVEDVGDSSTTVVAGPVAIGTAAGGRSFRTTRRSLGEPDFLVTGDAEEFVYRLLSDGAPPDASALRTYEELSVYARRGTRLVEELPVRPELVAEVETSRGCSRWVVGGCSFCTECARYHLPSFRPPRDIVEEVRLLARQGVRNVRLGRQACFFSYNAKGVGEREFPEPQPEEIENLLRGCSSAGLNSLHIDNVNPGVVARYPGECRRIVRSIIRYCTPGNIAALGVESGDPEVVERNNLKALPEESMKAIRLISSLGSKVGWNGQPCFLPGINLLLGLPGETPETYHLNIEFLRRVLQEGLLVRRINIRRVVQIPGTPLYGRRLSTKTVGRYSRSFVQRVRSEIDRPMLRLCYPPGRILRGLVAEAACGDTTFCRFPGSYPVIVGVKGRIDVGSVVDSMVVDYGYRSLTGIPYPLDLNTCDSSVLKALPGLGDRRVARIIRCRPIRSMGDLVGSLSPDLPPQECLDMISDACGLDGDGATPWSRRHA